MSPNLMESLSSQLALLNNHLIVLSTDVDGNITFASDAFFSSSGYSSSDVLLKNLENFKYFDSTSFSYEAIWSRLRTGKSWQGELRIRRKEYGYLKLFARFYPNFDNKQETSLTGFTGVLHDIPKAMGSEFFDATFEEDQQMASYMSMIDNNVITSTTDVFGTITYVSSAFCEISGYSKEELLGQSHNIVRHSDMPSELYQGLWQTIQAGLEWRGEVKNRKKDGSHYWVDVNIKPNHDSHGEIVGYTAVRQDITDKKRIEELTVRDELTGAYNRRFYNQIIDTEIKRARRVKIWLGLLMLDADNFKKYNDSYGHQAGDEVLKSITSALDHTFKRSGDYVFRMGGEEFAVLYKTEKREQLLEVAEQARESVCELNMEHSGNLPYKRVTVSMGLMTLDPEQSYVVEELYKYADEALYRAKQNGRNTLEVVSSNTDDIELF